MFHRLVFFIAALLIAQTTTAQLFGDQQIISTEAIGATTVHSADLDGDGDMDILSASFSDDKIAWYENLGGGLFGDQQIISVQADIAWSVHSADLDSDGDMDVLSASYDDHKIAWYENLGGGLFGDQQIITTQANGAKCVQTADLDGDGDMDVLSASYFDNKIACYENLGGGQFGDQQIISTQANLAHSVYSADLDGDGDRDVLSASLNAPNRIAWYENLSGDLFGPQQNITNTQVLSPQDVHSADLDGDGDMDVLSASLYDDKIAWYENLGGGDFGDQQIITTEAEGATSVYTADLDGDGNMDVLSASRDDDKIAWYKNLGGGSFGDQQIISTEADFALSVYTADLDGDGDMDVLSASRDDDKIAWYENLLGEGCTDPDAFNYDPDMWIDDGSCCYYEFGCTVLGAENYDPLACTNDGSCRFEVVGKVFFDENENGVMDGADYGLPFQEVGLLPNELNLTTNDSGIFLVDATGSDEYTFELAENPLFPFFTTPQTLNFDATEENWNQDTIFFGVSDELPAFNLEANMYSVLGGFPCNDYRGHFLCFRNTSNVPIDVQLEFHYDSLFQDITLSQQIDSLGDNIAYLNFNDVAPFELICAEVELLSPTVDFIGEFLETSVEITAFYDGDEVAFDTDSLSQ